MTIKKISVSSLPPESQHLININKHLLVYEFEGLDKVVVILKPPSNWKKFTTIKSESEVNLDDVLNFVKECVVYCSDDLEETFGIYGTLPFQIFEQLTIVSQGKIPDLLKKVVKDEVAK